MANRQQEIETIGDLLDVLNPTTVYYENFPKKYVKNTIGIRTNVGDIAEGQTGATYKVQNTYQIVYFGDSRKDCINKSDQIRAIIGNRINLKTKIHGTNDYMTFVSFNLAPIFETETDHVYALSSLLVVESNAKRTLPTHEKMQTIHVTVSEGGT